MKSLESYLQLFGEHQRQVGQTRNPHSSGTRQEEDLTAPQSKGRLVWCSSSLTESPS